MKSTLGLLGTLCLVAGVAFLTVAAWIALRLAADALTAALVIGGVYVGLGLICFALVRVVGPKSAVSEPPPPPTLSPHAQVIGGVVAAFVEGVMAGVAARRK